MRKLVIIPVYNEADTLERVIDRIKKYHDGDIVVVDDGSTDGSSRILDAIPGIAVISHARNLGYGRSLNDGFAYAVENRYDLALTIDCDEQHEPAMIPKMIEAIGPADVLSGSRYLEEGGANGEAPRDRRKINKIITGIVNDITGYGLTDAFCGFKCYKVAALARLSLDEPGYAHPMQFWVQAKHFGLKVAEIGVPLIYKNLDRSFGGELDDPNLRLEYYMRVLEGEACKWSMSLSSELTRTI